MTHFEAKTRVYSREEVGRVDTFIGDYALAARRFLPTLIRHRCPACGQGDFFRTPVYLKEKCPHCQVRFEREPGGMIVSMVLNYFITILICLLTAIVYVSRFGFNDAFLPLILSESIVLAVLLYQPSKALYLWLIWLFGFVHVDRPKRSTKQSTDLG